MPLLLATVNTVRFSCQEMFDRSVSMSVDQAFECTLESLRHSEARAVVWCRPGPAPFCAAAGGLRSPLAAAAPPLPLSHLMRWRTREDSSVISPERFLRQGRTSRSSSMMRTTAQTAIRA